MDTQEPVAHRLDRVTAHVRLLADLMVGGKDLQDVERGAFAHVLEDLAAALERLSEDFDACRQCPLREGRPC